MANTSEHDDMDAPGFTLPPFDWSAPISEPLMLTIAEIGDDDMRERLAGHKSLSDEAALILLALDRPSIAAAICRNINASATTFALAARPRDTVRVVRRAARLADEQASRNRSSFVAALQMEVPDVG